MRVAHLARKPLSEGSVGRNVLIHGTGGINVDAIRAGEPSPSIDRRKYIIGISFGGSGWVTPPRPFSYNEQKKGEMLGRWPANLVLVHKPECQRDACVEGCPVKELDEQSGIPSPRGNVNAERTGGGMFGHPEFIREQAMNYDRGGGASRFFKAFFG